METQDKLHKIYSNVVDWLKFAESKNSMLMAFNGASIYGIAKVLDHEYLKSEFLIGMLQLSMVLLIFSAVLSLLSFVPRLTIISGGLFAGKSATNMHYFEYLKGLSTAQILDEIGEKKVDNPTNYELHLAEQIKQNSIIASRKYSYFGIAVWLTISAYVTVIFAGLLLLYTMKEDFFNRK